jgi:large subunit ribosomal protein L22
VAGTKTNEREGTRAVLRHARMSPYKARQVLDLIRGRAVHEAEDILRFSERDAAFMIGKVLHSAVANAENNDELDPEELFVSACFADEGTTIKRWRPRARGRATRIRKRTCHVTIIVSRMPDEELRRQQARRRAEQLAQRARRVAGARRAEGDQRSRAERRHGGPQPEVDETPEDETPEDEAPRDAAEAPDGGEGEAPEAETAEGGDTAEATDAAEAEETAEATDPETTDTDTETTDAEATEAGTNDDDTTTGETSDSTEPEATNDASPAEDGKDEE